MCELPCRCTFFIFFCALGRGVSGSKGSRRAAASGAVFTRRPCRRGERRGGVPVSTATSFSCDVAGVEVGERHKSSWLLLRSPKRFTKAHVPTRSPAVASSTDLPTRSPAVASSTDLQQGSG